MYVEYVNARVHGMAGRLLTGHAIERLIAQTSVEGILRELEKTPYRDDVVEARSLYQGIACIEWALRKNFSRTCRKIYELVRDERGSEYVTIFLQKWDIQNLKTLIRGKNIHVPQEEIAGCLIPAGSLDEVTLLELLKQTDVRGIIDLMATWQVEYSVPLTEHLEEFMEHKNPGVLEYALDEYYYSSSLASIRGRSKDDRIVQDLLRTEIDATNLMTVFIMIRDRVPPDEGAQFLLSGGEVFGKKILLPMLETQDLGKSIKMLEKTPFRFLCNTPENVIGAGKISVIEKEINRFLIQKTVRTFRGDPLSFTIVIGFLRAKLNEIINIRVIARSRSAGLADDVMEAEMVHV